MGRLKSAIQKFYSESEGNLHSQVRGARGVKMEKVVLQAEKRDVIGKQVKALRRAGKLPAGIYGRHTDPLNVSLDSHTASLVLGKLTSSSLVTIQLDGKEYPPLVREKQRDYIKIGRASCRERV